MEKVVFAPHVREEGGFSATVRTVIFALLPALIWSVYAFGWRVLFVAVVAMASALAAEALICRFLRRRPFPWDGSTALSGLIFAMLMPPAVSLPLAALGGVLAAGVKQAFGGLGKNPVNPALTAAGLIYPFFSRLLTLYTAPFERLPALQIFFTAEETASLAGDPEPLANLKAGLAPAQSWYQLLSGDVPGALGAGSVLLLLAGGLTLLATRAATWHAPVAFLAAVALTGLFRVPAGEEAGFAALWALLSGGTVFGAFFCLTDPVTGPVTRWGKLLYGVLAGVLTGAFRLYLGSVFAMVYAVLIANLLARPLDFLFRPRPYGRPYFCHLRRRS